jgi:hypothetical protein
MCVVDPSKKGLITKGIWAVEGKRSRLILPIVNCIGNFSILIHPISIGFVNPIFLSCRIGAFT